MKDAAERLEAGDARRPIAAADASQRAKRIVIVGGAGVFGRRLGALLARDGHRVWLGGRDLRGTVAAAAPVGAQALRVDRTGDLTAIARLKPDVIVDAAGPFQNYANDDADPYRLARFAIAHSAHYFDLADDPDFVAGIGALDETARRAGVVVLSGASSVPALSSAAVASLTRDLDAIDAIESAIVPGERAPRGRSVIASVVAQVGATGRRRRGGRDVDANVWRDPRRYALSDDLRRSAWTIGAPDLALFPDFFGARTVDFRAGLDPWPLNLGLSLLGWLRRRGVLRNPARLAPFLHWLVDRPLPFGADRGGMIVDVVGEKGERSIRRRWTLIAEAGDGPWVPAVPIRALLRRLDALAPGARPCLAETPLEELTAAMEDLRVTASASESAATPLFETVHGEQWRTLAPSLQRLHRVRAVEVFQGRATVERGGGLVAILAAALFGFPRSSDDVPLTLEKTRIGAREIWRRRFGDRSFTSTLTPAGAHRVVERFGPFSFELDLPIEAGGQSFPVRRGWFLGLPLPRFALPISETREFDAGGVAQFDVGLHAPLGLGLMVRYRGWIKPVDDGQAR